jgi:hypothetical protein
MDKIETLGRIADLKAQIKTLEKELDAAKEQAVLKGYATWTYTMNGQLSNKAPSMKWWQAHRKESFARLCEKSKDPNHPDHEAFWKNPSKRFALV